MKDAQGREIKHGTPEFYREIGRRGGRANVAKHGPEGLAKAGQIGGEAVYRKHGKRHYQRAVAIREQLKAARAQAQEAKKAQHQEEYDND